MGTSSASWLPFKFKSSKTLNDHDLSDVANLIFRENSRIPRGIPTDGRATLPRCTHLGHYKTVDAFFNDTYIDDRDDDRATVYSLPDFRRSNSFAKSFQSTSSGSGSLPTSAILPLRVSSPHPLLSLLEGKRQDTDCEPNFYNERCYFLPAQVETKASKEWTKVKLKLQSKPQLSTEKDDEENYMSPLCLKIKPKTMIINNSQVSIWWF